MMKSADIARLIGAVLLVLTSLTSLAVAQLPPGGTSLVVGTTPVSGGINGNCLTISGVALGSATCGAGGPAGGDLTGTYPNPTLVGVITAGGPTGSATVTPIITYDAKGRLTTVTSATITPAIGSVTGLGTGIATALGTNVETAGAPVINGGALGTPSGGTGTNITGLVYTALPALSANQLLGALTATTPSGQSLPSCSTAASALQWTSGTGFGCNSSITANAVPAANLTGSTLAAGVTASSLTSLGTITTLTATTINAFTLGGTIAGGGNQINNVIIGTTTPLAGFFTTISAKTASANALSAGLNGSTNPAFNVDASTALQVAGLNVKGAVTGGTVLIVATDSGASASVDLEAKGAGQITIGGTSTGNINVGNASTTTQFNGSSTFGGNTTIYGFPFQWLRPDLGATWKVAYSSNDTLLRWTDSANTANAITFGLNGQITTQSSTVSAGTKPSLALAGGTCAGTVITGGAIAGTVTLTGVCAITNTMTLSSMPTAPTGYVCDVTDRTTAAAAPRQTSTSATSAVFTFGGTSGTTDVIQYKCIAY